MFKWLYQKNTHFYVIKSLMVYINDISLGMNEIFVLSVTVFLKISRFFFFRIKMSKRWVLIEQKLTRQSSRVICDLDKQFVDSVREGNFKNIGKHFLFLKDDFVKFKFLVAIVKKLKILLLFNLYAASYLLT